MEEGRPAYPQWLEDWWLRRAARELGGGVDEAGREALLRRLVPRVQELSDIFTTERPAVFGGYMNEAETQLAYGLFYFPQTFVRCRWPLREAALAKGWRPPATAPGEALRVLDLGSGPGSAGLTAALWLRELAPGAPVDLLAVDHSAPPFARLRDLVEAHPAQLGGLRLRTAIGNVAGWPQRAAAAERGFHLIVISFALNEAMARSPASYVAAWLRKLAARLAPGGLLLAVEPALQVTAARLMEVRDLLLTGEGGPHVWGPCLHARPCPMRAEGRYWCHEVRRWQAPPALEFLNRTLFRSIGELKFSFLLLGRDPPPAPAPGPGTFRLTSPFAAAKGQYVATGCAADGQLHAYDLQTRALGPAQTAAADALERGDLLRAEPPPTALGGPRQWRLRDVPAPWPG